MEQSELEQLPGPVRKRVRTPLGEVTFIIDQLGFFQETDANTEKFENTEDAIRCKRCSGEASVVAVKHYVIRTDQDLLNLDPDDENDSKAVVVTVPYCNKCDEVPDPVGEPIAPLKSFYNRVQ